MPVDNEKFVTLLGDAKVLCQAKLDAFTLVRGQDDEPLQKLKVEAQETYQAFSDPQFKLITFSFDEIKIRNLLGDIDEVTIDKFEDFDNKLRGMLEFLKNTALKEAVAVREQLPARVINQEVLAALTRCATKMTQRINKFKNAVPSVDILADPDYLFNHDIYEEVRSTYRTLLKDEENPYPSKESDIISIDNRGELMANAADKSEFLTQFEKLTVFIEGKVAAAPSQA